MINEFGMEVMGVIGRLPLAQGAAEEAADQLTQVVNSKFNHNELWRFTLLLGILVATLVVGRLVRYFIERAATRLEQKEGVGLTEMFLQCLSRPASVAVFAAGAFAARLSLRFDLTGLEQGFSKQTYALWGKVSTALAVMAVAYLIYRLVDIVEHYLKKVTERTETALDDMLVPVVRKSLRVFIAVISVLFVADNVLDMELGALLATAGVGGLAVALAAKETIANFFGSINIFADQPFQVNERIRVEGVDGTVENVGFRSTRIRTLDGHQVSIPNSKIANEVVENIGRRPFIKRVANLGVTYDTPPDKVERAVEIVKDILAQTEEVNRDGKLPPRVYFTEFKDYYLNILVIYWITPPDYWMFVEVNQRVNLAIMRAFAAEGIEFAFPTQTLIVNKSEA